MSVIPGTTIEKLRQELDSLYQIESVMAVLGYDQQVLMPPAASSGRARQLEYLSAMHHEKLSSDNIWNIVLELMEVIETLDFDNQVIVRELHRTLLKSRKLPVSFVAERSRINAESFSVWCEARPKDDWQRVMPYLERIVQLGQEEAKLIGYRENPYDVLLDNFEPYATISVIKPLLLDLARQLKTVVPVLNERFAAVPGLSGSFPQRQQQELCCRVMKDLGFDFESGRLDTAAHPFMSTLGYRDIRITTRYSEQSFLPALYGTIHESGHAFYEAGLPEQYRGTPRGSAVSMGIHESQARLWENIVGRSWSFMQYVNPLIAEFLNFRSDENTLWNAANKVNSSLIRVEADEVTYTLHIVIRMLIEEQLISGQLKVEDAPEQWNSLYREYLGIDVPRLSLGIMQDVHWFSGSIGYFPSYALGNLYGAMFIEQFESEQGTLAEVIKSRSFILLKKWLTERIFSLGQSYCASDLVRNICGKPLSSAAFVNYLSRKFEIHI